MEKNVSRTFQSFAAARDKFFPALTEDLDCDIRRNASLVNESADNQPAPVAAIWSCESGRSNSPAFNIVASLARTLHRKSEPSARTGKRNLGCLGQCHALPSRLNGSRPLIRGHWRGSATILLFILRQ